MFLAPFLRRDVPALEGARTELRMPRLQDYDAWAQLRGASRSFLEPWEPRWAPDELSHHAFRQRLKRYRSEYERGVGIAFFIYERTRRELAGGLSVSNIRRGVAQCGHIGYWMGERFAGRGLMLDALQVLIPFSFEQLQLHRLEAACIPDNTRSMRLLEKAGFQREGLMRSYLRINGCWQDHFLYALIAGEHSTEPKRG